MIHGSDTIATRALERTAAAIVHSLLNVQAKDVRISLGDDSGGLSIAVETPLAIEPLGAIANASPVLQRLHAARAVLVDRMAELTGRRVTRVDIRVTGSRVRQQSRSLA